MEDCNFRSAARHNSPLYLPVLGIAIGLTPLGAQLGRNVPIAFAEIVPWDLSHIDGPLFINHCGELLAVGLTVGAFPKKLLRQSVALGVTMGMGIATGIFKIAYNLPLFW
ncbi:MAG: hypothetical protein ACJAUG_002385, partial [Halioglobus sp.]